MDTKLRYETGRRMGGYRILRAEPLPHLRGAYVELLHEPTGARHIHIDASDESKAFSVSFQTVPQDSRGVAHILEHVVLAGSERFGIRDPFFKMYSRSIRDFMNAMTFYDCTGYPFSTRNLKDFYNLLEVYLDAVLFPLIPESAFKQEGHRLEFDQPDAPTSPLRRKGVVFNEMKGMMASDATVTAMAIGRALFPDTTYAVNAGGDPERIPELSWQDLREFHATHYHPSNARFYTYGDLPLEEVLGKIEELALSRFDRIAPARQVELPLPASPTELRDVFPLSPDEDPARRSQVLLAWATASSADPFAILSMIVLADILLGNAASPLRKALMDSGLGSALADGSGFRDSYKQAVFCAGLKGCEPEDADRIEELVLQTLRRTAETGLDPEQVEAAVHKVELSTREVSNSGFPYSLKVWFYLREAYEYDGDPYRALQTASDFERLRAELAAGPYFEDLIRRMLLENPHRARVVVAPDQQLEERRRQDEETRLAEIEAGLSEEDRNRIVEEAFALKAEQESEQDISVLPTLELRDIEARPHQQVGEQREIQGALAGFAEETTNGLTYLTVAVDLSGLPDPLVDRLGLFARALTRSGAGKHDHLQQALRIDRYTGGIEAKVRLRTTAGGDRVMPHLVIGAKSLSANQDKLLEILGELLASPRFEPARSSEVLAEYRAQIESSLSLMGTGYANLLALSRLTVPGSYAERAQGITHLRALRRLEDEAAMTAAVDELAEMASLVFRRERLKICVTADGGLARLESLLGEVLEQLPEGSSETLEGLPHQQLKPSGPAPAVTISAPVVYNAKVLPTVPYTDPDAAALLVLGQWLWAKLVHQEIREKGGAYGSTSSADVERGTFNFGSYRDPHVTRTFGTFEAAARLATETQPSDRELTDAILQALSEADPLLSPEMRHSSLFFDALAGYTPEVRARFKQRLLEVKAADLSRVAGLHLLKEGSWATLGNAEKIAAANEELGGAFEISPI